MSRKRLESFIEWQREDHILRPNALPRTLSRLRHRLGTLRGKRVLEIPIASLLAGTQYRGQMEERLVALVREAQQSDVILFFDEVHTLVGAGQTTGGQPGTDAGLGVLEHQAVGRGHAEGPGRVDSRCAPRNGAPPEAPRRWTCPAPLSSRLRA